LTVRKDPNTAGTEADIAAQTEMLVALRRDLNTAIDVLNRIELVRSQVESLGRVVDDGQVRKAADDLNKTFIDLEMTLIDLRITGGQDIVRYAAKLISRFGYLANGLSNARFQADEAAGRGAEAPRRARARHGDPVRRPGRQGSGRVQRSAEEPQHAGHRGEVGGGFRASDAPWPGSRRGLSGAAELVLPFRHRVTERS
jgi:hypothetical protein